MIKHIVFFNLADNAEGKTKAEIARNQGLEPLAKIMMGQRATDLNSIALKYLNKEWYYVSQTLFLLYV